MKTILAISPHSVIDVITNSSSELFVGLAKSKDMIVSMIEDVHPNYLSEYLEIKTTKELTLDDLDLYLMYADAYHIDLTVMLDISDEDMEKYTKGESYRYFDYENYIKDTGIDVVKKLLDPDNKMFFLFSIDDNPDWDYQMELESFMTRYHLG